MKCVLIFNKNVPPINSDVLVQLKNVERPETR
jgi:hypothetical protein